MKDKKDKSTYRKEELQEERRNEDREKKQDRLQDETRREADGSVQRKSTEKPAYMQDEEDALIPGQNENARGTDFSPSVGISQRTDNSQKADISQGADTFRSADISQKMDIPKGADIPPEKNSSRGKDTSDTYTSGSFSDPVKPSGKNGPGTGIYGASAEGGEPAPESRSRKLEEERARKQQTKKGRKQLQKEEKKEKKRRKKAIKKARKKQRLSVAPVIPMAILICLLIVLFALRSMLFNVSDPGLIDLIEGTYTAPEVTIDSSASTQEQTQETATPAAQPQNEEASSEASSAEQGQ